MREGRARVPPEPAARTGPLTRHERDEAHALEAFALEPAPGAVHDEQPLVAGLHRHDEPRPDAEWSPTALANWARVTDKRAKLIFEDSAIGPSEAYGGTRAAT